MEATWSVAPKSVASPGIYVLRVATFRSPEEWLAQEQWWLMETWVRDCLVWCGYVMSSPSAHYCNDWDGIPVDCYRDEAETCDDFAYSQEEERIINENARHREAVMLGTGIDF